MKYTTVLTFAALTIMALQPLSAHARRGHVGGGGGHMGGGGGGFGGGGHHTGGGGIFGGGGHVGGSSGFGGGGHHTGGGGVFGGGGSIGGGGHHVGGGGVYGGGVAARPRGYRAIPSGYYGGHAVGYMPPFHSAYSRYNYRPGYRIPLVGYPNWFWYAGTLLYFDALANTYYDQTGNPYTMPADVLVGEEMEPCEDSCCCCAIQ